MTGTFTDDEVGKAVTTATGDPVGTVSSVGSGCLYVEPSPALPTALRERLGWTASDSREYRLDHVAVVAVTEDTVELHSEFSV